MKIGSVINRNDVKLHMPYAIGNNQKQINLHCYFAELFFKRSAPNRS